MDSNYDHELQHHFRLPSTRISASVATMPVSKATKKFQKKHLSDTLEKRKGLKKTKQQQQLKERKKKRRAEEEGKDGETDGQPTTNGNNQKAVADAFKDMSVDDFFQGGVEVPAVPEKQASKRRDIRFGLCCGAGAGARR